MTSKEAMGLLEILQLIMTHPNIRDYADEDLKAGLSWINKQLMEHRE
jgi:hypothetical protein